jgi:hypothetical protein
MIITEMKHQTPYRLNYGLSIITSNRTNSSQTTEQNHHKRPKKHQKICLALNVTISVERQRQHEG